MVSMFFNQYTRGLFLTVFILCTWPTWSQELELIEVNYCVDPDWGPYESIANQQHIGISKQYINILSSLSPLRFNLVITENWDQSLTFVKSGKCQLLPLLNKSSKREKFLTFSDVYFRAPNALYSHFNQPMVGSLSGISGQSVAVVKDYRMHHYLKAKFPQMNIVEVATEQEGLILVESEKVDYFVGSFYSANIIIQALSLSQLRIVGIAELEDNLRFGVNKESEHLLPIINQAIAQLSEDDHNHVYSYLKALNLVKETDYSIAIKSGIIFTVITIILLVGYWRSVKYTRELANKNIALEKLHKQLDQKNQQLANLAIRDSLTMLYNRAHLAEMINQQIKLKSRYNTKSCLIMIDIDDFKKINDNFGHKLGDDILKSFSFILTECARDTDIAARWGGEEFVLLCPETEMDEATLLAKRFQKALHELKSDAFPNVTCSIGIAELNNKDSADEWFISADNAMYQAKRQGKNSIFTVF